MLESRLPKDARETLSLALGRPGPVAVSVEGRAGEDLLVPVLRALDRRRKVVFTAPGLTDLENRAGFRDVVRAALGLDLPPEPNWTDAVTSVFQSGPVVLVLHRPRGLAQAHRAFWTELGAGWATARRGGSRSALVLVDEEHGLTESLGGTESPFALPGERLGSDLRQGPLERITIPPRVPGDMLEAGSPWVAGDLLTAWSLLGTRPARWETASGRRSPAEAARRLVWRGSYEAPDRALSRWVQTPHRYASMLRALSQGARSRRELSAAVDRASTSRSASGPYLKRLVELGLVAVERPLDASSGSRRSRYRLTDPHEAFWWSCIHPLGARPLTDPDPRALWARAVQPRIQRHLIACLPTAVRAFLWRDAEGRFGAPPREVGPLWGEGYDFPAAATLRNGAVCYAHIHGGGEPCGLDALATLDRQMRDVRYGFGRQARLRLLVSITGFDDALRREAARNHFVQLVGPQDLAGESEGRPS